MTTCTDRERHSLPFGSAVCSCICPKCYVSLQDSASYVCLCVCVLISQSVVGQASRSLGAAQLAEPGQRDSPMGVNFAVRALVHPFDQVLLVQQRVVGAERAGGVKKTLVVMAELCLPLRGQELVNVHHLAQ